MNQPNNLPEEYAVIRDSIEPHPCRCHHDYECRRCKALAALARLAAREGEKCPKCQTVFTCDCGKRPAATPEVATPPAPPAALETCWICNKPKGQPPDRCPGHYMGTESEPEFLRSAPPAAQHGEARSEIALDCDVCAGTGKVNAPEGCVCGGTGRAVDAAVHLRSMVYQLRSELAQARKATEEAQTLADRFEGALKCSNETAKRRGDELRRAMDALMETAIPLETIGNEIRASERAHPQMCIELQAAVLRAQDRVREFVAAYDAKHGEKR